MSLPDALRRACARDRACRVALRLGIAVACALAACRPGELPPPGRPTVPAGLPSAEPTLRVGIVVDSASVTVSATRDFEIRAADRVLARSPAARTWSFRADDAGRIEARSETGESTGWERSPLRVITDARSMIRIGEREYRGEALVRAVEGRRVTAINIVQLEEYLLGVVPREMGRRPASEIEALKAQAVAARTYAIGSLGSREAHGFDVYATVQDQVYGGVLDEDTIVTRAVRETSGEILTHAGAPILAYYSSTCGGSTANIEDSWPWRAPLPYLRAVSDRVPGTDQHYCDTSSRFRWSTRWTRAELLAVLAQTLPLHTRDVVSRADRVDTVELVGVNASERATVHLRVDGRSHTLRADSLRWVLRPQPGAAILNSSRLYSIVPETRDGEVQALEIDGGGWGHAIGMCQVGAMGRARAGQRYAEILRTYYTGAQLTRLY
jgi:stage II sporulation protein D